MLAMGGGLNLEPPPLLPHPLQWRGENPNLDLVVDATTPLVNVDDPTPNFLAHKIGTRGKIREKMKNYEEM